MEGSIMWRAIYLTILFALSAAILITPSAMEKNIIKINGASIIDGIIFVWFILMLCPGLPIIFFIIIADGFYTRGVKFRVMELLMAGPKTPCQLQDEYNAKWEREVRLAKVFDALNLASKQSLIKYDGTTLTGTTRIELTKKGEREVHDARRHGEAGLKRLI